MHKSPNAFLVVVDVNGEIWEIIPRSASMEDISYSVAHSNRIRSWVAPHSVWLWNGAVWYPFRFNAISNGFQF
jgi:hypothetical protein